jgi:hypothetical protein
MARTKRYFAGEEVESDGGRGAAGTSETVTPSKPKANIVTKEELEKSGLSLRDYMNKQQGLTRRGESSAPTPKSSPVTKNEGMSMTKMDPEKAQDAKRLGEQMVARDKAIVQQQSDKIVKDYRAKQASQKEANIGASMGGYKAGGKVSASSRADGIAQRGKTRGTMVMCGGGMAKGKR